jgi:hypothetical protein
VAARYVVHSILMPHATKTFYHFQYILIITTVTVTNVSYPLEPIFHVFTFYCFNSILTCFSFPRPWAPSQHFHIWLPDDRILNAEICRSILSTNTLNEWCICWSFTHQSITTVFNIKILGHVSTYRLKYILLKTVKKLEKQKKFGTANVLLLS